jgi:lysyl-tRNA synthetase class 2
VESITLATVAYDADRELLQIEFRDRTIYRYFNVPGDVHESLLRAPSKGSYFNRIIRGQFTYARIS